MKLSIITVNLNNKSGLQKTIDSVITQTWKEFEWIIIDGGSTDGSKELIEKYSSYITYWVSEPDKGIYNAMNKGIKVAKGEYLQFLNSGDCLYNKKTNEDIFLKKYKIADIITGNIICEGKIVKGIAAKDISLNDFFYGNILHPSTYIKRELFEQYGYYDEELEIVSDWKFFLITIILKNVSITYVDKVLVDFDGTGISSSNISKVAHEKLNVIKRILPDRIYKDYKFIKNEFMISRNPITRFIYAIMIRFLSLKWNSNYNGGTFI